MYPDATTTVDARQAACFERLKSTLLADKYKDRLAKPLGHWALPNDRRLPQALLGRPLADVLSRPFSEIAATRGIGPKKIESLFVLLSRAAAQQPPGVDLVAARAPDFHVAEIEADPNVDDLSWTRSVATAGDLTPLGAEFDAGIVSEALWQVWQRDVLELGVGDLTIGQVVDSLDGVPTVLWQTPLEKWIERCLASETAPMASEIAAQFAAPLLTQIQRDCGEGVARLAEERLGTMGKPHSVRSQARRLGVTRARIYQLFEQCGKAIEVRWPAGRALTRRLEGELATRTRDGERLRLFNAAVELCYPRRFEL
jgi:hypothetical protein